MLDLIRRYRAVFIIALMLALPLGTLVITRGKPGRHVVDRVAIASLSTVQAGASFGIDFIENFWEDYVALRDLKQENEQLQKEIAVLREERARLIGALQENVRLRGLLDFKQQRPELKLIPAHVIAREMSPYFRVIRIRLDTRGAQIEIAPQMAVINRDGVVGQIIEVYGGFADVMLVADPRSSVDVINQRTRARGLVVGLGHKRDYNAKLSYLLRKDEVVVGDPIVTSGKGGIFPQELIIGEVSSVDYREYGLHQDATLNPAVDVGRIEEVFIVAGEGAAGVRP